jgi:hypothetical protein
MGFVFQGFLEPELPHSSISDVEMMTRVLKQFRPPRCREVMRLRPKFAVKEIHIDDGLHQRIVASSTSDADAGFTLGRLIHRHACGIFGPISNADRLLNKYLLKEAALRGGKHMFVSRHRAGLFMLDLATDLRNGKTTIRLAATSPVAHGG